jgi:SET domain-containing protein
MTEEKYTFDLWRRIKKLIANIKNESKNKLAIKSYISPKIVIYKSEIHGSGMFAKNNIRKGEIVFIKGGYILTKEELFSTEKIGSYLPIDDDYFIGSRNKDEEDGIKLFVNHSCKPNCGLRGEITFVAMRDVRKGEELTCDYAMIDDDDYEFACHCGSEHCRKKITGFDWKIKYLQRKYSGYFARYLIDKIAPEAPGE